MKKAYKILEILMIVIMLASICTNVFAAITIDSINTSASLGDTDTTMTNIASKILTLITNVAIILSVIILAVIGIKYMFESSEGKAEYKKTMMPYVVGAVLALGAGGIAKFVTSFGKSLVSGTTPASGT